jgi:microcystin-dependent protein
MLACFGFNFAPRSWSTCEAQLIAISQNQTLFSLIGTFYGGDGRTTFALPDLRGRIPISQGRGPGLNDYRIGSKTGTELHTMTQGQMPTHSHAASFTSGGSTATVEASTSAGTNPTPAAGDYLGAGGLGATQANYVPNGSQGTTVALGGVSAAGGGGTVTVAPNGGNQSFSILQPILAVNWCIAMFGIYPSRN